MYGHTTIVDVDGSNEAEFGDGFVEFGVGDRGQRLQDLGLDREQRGGHSDTLSLAPAATSTPPSPAGSARRNSAGTSMSYSAAALSPRIFRFCSTVICAYSPSMSSGIWKSTNFSMSHFGVHSA